MISLFTPHRPLRAALVFIVLLYAPLRAQAPSLQGVVRDPTGGVVVGAEVRLIAPPQLVVATARTDDRGQFTLPAAEPGTFVVETRAAGFADVRTIVDLPAAASRPLEIVTGAPVLAEEVSVTALVAEAEPAARLTQPVNVIDADEIALRAKSVVVQAAGEEVGLHVQRTSPVMAGVFVRGLTGNKVNVFVDGVRYSTAAQRGGVSTFLDLLDPALVDSIEVLRGPNSAEYGSDALGGSLQFLSRVPGIAVEGQPRFGGTFAASANTADSGVVANVTASYAASRFGLLGAAAARRIGDLRVGGGIDSHAAVTRFFGVPSNLLMPSHLPDTGFRQLGAQLTINWLPGANGHVVASYRRGAQDDGARYDQLLGGDGNLVADLRDLTLDLFYVRYERFEAGWFDSLSVTGSINSQHEERVNQGGNGNPRATITFEPERTTAYGVQAALRKQIGERTSAVIGGDFNPEGVTARSTGLNPVTGVSSVRRGRVPDGARYRSGGAFAQILFEPIASTLQVVGNVRVNGAAYRARAADGRLPDGRTLWPDDELSTAGAAFRVGASARASEDWTVTANVSRGFRAPHITDLGTLGLTGSGFEVAAPDVAGLGATVGTTADASAASTGRAVEQVGAETSLAYEGGLHWRRRNLRSSLAIFVNDVHDNIAKQTLILPPGAVGRLLGGTPITAQTADGAVFVAAATNPVLVRANFDNARIFGVEHTFDWRPASAWSAGTTFTYLHAEDTATGLPPNIEGGTPAPEAYVRATYRRPSGKWWAGAIVHAAAAQHRLSSLDLDDRRTGAGRSRANIRDFFLNGATARGWVSPGPDGAIGTADDVLSITGETLAQIQDRVLGPGVNAAPLFREVRGYTTIGLRGGVRIGAHDLVIDAENLTDANYRGVSWGVDAPGRGVSVRYVARF
jgi:outer membrane receptor protein involved in Fe transport